MSTQNKLILIIEDEPEIADILQMYLHHEGFQTEHVNNGQHGLQSWQLINPALILLDIRIPGPDGLDVLQTIRSTSNIPIIILSALTDDINKLLSLRLGADDYITKPFNPAELIARIRTVLRRSNKTSAADRLLRVDRLTINQDSYTAFYTDDAGVAHDLPLTLTEFRLLSHFAEQPKTLLYPL